MTRYFSKSMELRLLLLLAIVFALRLVGLAGPLVFDDLHSIVYNPAVKSFSHFFAWFTDGQSFSCVKGIHAFRPLVLITLALDHSIGGGDAWPFKVDNLLQHLVTVALAFLTLRKLLPRAGLSQRAVELGAFLGALLFGVHPLHVETLGLASSRSEILATTGLLIAMYGWLANPDAWRRRAFWLALGTAFSLLAKMTGVLVPAIVGLVELVLPADPALRGRFIVGLRTRLISWLPIAASIPVLLVWYYARAYAMGERIVVQTSATSNPLYGDARDLWTQLEGSAFFVPKAFLLWLFPVGLTIDHTEFFKLGWTALPPLAGALFLALSLGFAAWSWRRRPLLTLSVFASFAFILPWIVVRLNMPLAEHRMYPVALFLAIAPAAFFARSLASSSLWTRRLAGMACVALVLFWSYRSVAWAASWRSDRVLWEACLRQSPKSVFVWAKLGKVDQRDGNYLAAVRDLEKAHALHGRKRPIHLALVEARLNTLRWKTSHGQATNEAFLETTKRRLADLVERWPDRFRGAMHLAEFAEIWNPAQDAVIAREGFAWGLSVAELGGDEVQSVLLAARAARAGGKLLEAALLLEAARADGHTGDDILGELCRVQIERRKFVEAHRLLRQLRGISGPGSAFSKGILELAVRLAAKQGDASSWSKSMATMRRLGYPTDSLPSLERGSGARSSATPK